MVRALLKRKADVNVQELKGHTPLIIAAVNKHYLIVGDLLEAGAHVLSTDSDKGQTALHIASIKNDIKTARVIIEFCHKYDAVY